MPRHVVNIHSPTECQMLIDRVRDTMQALAPAALGRVQQRPPRFLQNDNDIFERLCMAILSNGSGWRRVNNNRAQIGAALLGCHLGNVAALTERHMAHICTTQIVPLGIPSRVLLSTKLEWVRQSAITLRTIQQRHGTVSGYISREIQAGRQDALRVSLTRRGSPSKLKGVGFGVCCEFFKQIGVDDVKPDVHLIRFFIRTGINATASQDPIDTWRIGITIANTLGVTRTYVDSLIWTFCAKDYGQICTANPGQCHLCTLKTGNPQLCPGVGETLHAQEATSSCSFKEAVAQCEQDDDHYQ